MSDETLPHGTQPTEAQWQVAEALDDLVMSHGVVLDDDRLDWLVEWHQNRLCDHRHEWASWLESWEGAVVPEPPTISAVIDWLRADRLPFGYSAATDHLPTPEADR